MGRFILYLTMLSNFIFIIISILFAILDDVPNFITDNTRILYWYILPIFLFLNIFFLVLAELDIEDKFRWVLDKNPFKKENSIFYLWYAVKKKKLKSELDD